MLSLDSVIRNIDIDFLQTKVIQIEVVRTENIYPNTISRLWNRYKQTDCTLGHSRSGRHRLTTLWQDRKNPRISSTESNHCRNSHCKWGTRIDKNQLKHSENLALHDTTGAICGLVTSQWYASESRCQNYWPFK